MNWPSITWPEFKAASATTTPSENGTVNATSMTVRASDVNRKPSNETVSDSSRAAV
ncbi:hypothetical protein [Frondihabitans sp. Leaf304]|uniref:hypothetical protein n=1 Tax=Frondihabitans sp. Leaf304 TaxID=1736329 RepID=UPI0012FBDCBC|nr:hypothetical protein [Frondihabitans sp. Leaf304]